METAEPIEITTKIDCEKVTKLHPLLHLSFIAAMTNPVFGNKIGLKVVKSKKNRPNHAIRTVKSWSC